MGGHTRDINIRGVTYTLRENRVKPSMFGGQVISDEFDPRLVKVHPTWRAGGLHWLAAAAFNQLSDAAVLAGFEKPRVAAWRPSIPTYEEYLAKYIPSKYPTERVLKNSIAWRGSHMLGLAVDFINNGMESNFGGGRSKQKKMLKLPFFYWLVQNAGMFGFTPLIGSPARDYWYHEPWHWELNITEEQWLSAPDGSLVASLSQAGRRAGAFAGATRRQYFGASASADSARQEVEVARIPETPGVFIEDKVDTSGLLFDFASGRWVV